MEELGLCKTKIWYVYEWTQKIILHKQIYHAQTCAMCRNESNHVWKMLCSNSCLLLMSNCYYVQVYILWLYTILSCSMRGVRFKHQIGLRWRPSQMLMCWHYLQFITGTWHICFWRYYISNGLTCSNYIYTNGILTCKVSSKENVTVSLIQWQQKTAVWPNILSKWLNEHG